MIDRLTICDEICRRVHINRRNPMRTSLTKQEMISVWRHLIRTEARIAQLDTEIRVKDAEATRVQT